MERLNKFTSRTKNAFITDITPEEACLILTHRNCHNRKLVQGTASSYKRQMLNGLWESNGESIVFDKNGQLLDGQHRLHACWKSNITMQEVVVAVGFGTETFKTIDSGKMRSFKDTLTSGKLTEDETIISKIVRQTYYLQIGTPTEHGTSSTRSVANNDELCEFYTTNKTLFDSLVPYFKTWQKNDKERKIFDVYVLTGIAGYLVMKGCDLKKVNEYISLITGNNYSSNQTTLSVRTKFEKYKNIKSTPLERITALRYGWNAFSQGKNISRIKVNIDKGDFNWEII